MVCVSVGSVVFIELGSGYISVHVTIIHCLYINVLYIFMCCIFNDSQNINMKCKMLISMHIISIFVLRGDCGIFINVCVCKHFKYIYFKYIY